MRRRTRGPIGAGALLALVLLAGCGGPDPGRVTVCAQAAAVLAGVPSVHILSATQSATGVSLGHDHGRIACEFAPDLPQQGGIRLRRVVVDGGPPLSPTTLFLLQNFGLVGAAAPGGGTLGPVAYLAQQLLNAVGLAAVYALTAMGYALIYGIIGRINLAFGEVASFGTLAALAGTGLAALLAGGEVPAWAPAVAVVAAAGCGGLLGHVVDRLVFKPLQARTSVALLIATVGLSLSLAEGMRIVAGSKAQWLPAGPLTSLVLWSDGIAVVALGPGSAVAAVIALLLVAGMAWLMHGTAFGRGWRAVRDDPLMAGLCGLPVRRLVGASCVVGSACAGLGGAFLALACGSVGFDSGRLLGFKALVAAVLGGIGAPVAAAFGGLLLALFETLWAAYLTGAWRDAAVFGLLALLLIVRPQGLLGIADPRDGPGAGRLPRAP